MLEKERLLKCEDKTYFAYLISVIEYNIQVFESLSKKCTIFHKKEAKEVIHKLKLILPKVHKMEREAETYILRGITKKNVIHSHSKQISFSTGVN